MTFAFPYGSRALGFSGGALAAVARETGVLCALSTEAVPVTVNSDPFHWGRFNAFPWDSSATLAAKLEGWYSWAPRLRQRVGRALAAAEHGRARPGVSQTTGLYPRESCAVAKGEE